MLRQDTKQLSHTPPSALQEARLKVSPKDLSYAPDVEIVALCEGEMITEPNEGEMITEPNEGEMITEPNPRPKQGDGIFERTGVCSSW
jgi:hypothetical protein